MCGIFASTSEKTISKINLEKTYKLLQNRGEISTDSFQTISLDGLLFASSVSLIFSS